MKFLLRYRALTDPECVLTLEVEAKDSVDAHQIQRLLSAPVDTSHIPGRVFNDKRVWHLIGDCYKPDEWLLKAGVETPEPPVHAHYWKAHEKLGDGTEVYYCDECGAKGLMRDDGRHQIEVVEEEQR